MVVEQRQDRLSSLPDDILIGIIDCFPLKSAINTEILSRRWHGLWKNLTSIHIYSGEFEDMRKFYIAFDKIMKQITSHIHSFTVDMSKQISSSRWKDSWLRQICDHNVCVLKFSWPRTCGFSKLNKLPSFIFCTQSLVSLELGSTIGWCSPDDGDPINLPNLKYLSLDISYGECEWSGKLINSLPSLEELSLRFSWSTPAYIKCSNQNLRRLSMNLGHNESIEVVISARKLEYLDVVASTSAIFSFEDEPIVLREAKLRLTNQNIPPKRRERLRSEFYEGLFNVRFLTLDVFYLDNISSRFRHTTSLTLCLRKIPDNINTLFSLLASCPQLDVLTLKLLVIWRENEHATDARVFQQPSHVNPLIRARRIDIETDLLTYDKPAKSFWLLLQSLLINAAVLKRFQFKVSGPESARLSVEHERRIAVEFCKNVRRFPVVLTGCVIEFTGRYFKKSFKKSFKTSSKVLREQEIRCGFT